MEPHVTLNTCILLYIAVMHVYASFLFLGKYLSDTPIQCRYKNEENLEERILKASPFATPFSF